LYYSQRVAWKSASSVFSFNASITAVTFAYASSPFVTPKNSFSFSKVLTAASAANSAKAALTAAKSPFSHSGASPTTNYAPTDAKLLAAASTLAALEDPQPIF
jgi:hypothetical protein